MKPICFAAIALASALLAACSDKSTDTRNTPAPAAEQIAPATDASAKPAPSTPIAAMDSIALEASDAKVAHQPEAAALKDGRLRATGNAGVLAFGPYLPVAKGNYVATFIGKIDKVPAGEAIRFDAVSGAGNVPHGSVDVNASAGDGTIAQFPVTLDADVENLELRVHVPAGTQMELASYRLAKR